MVFLALAATGCLQAAEPSGLDVLTTAAQAQDFSPTVDVVTEAANDLRGVSFAAISFASVRISLHGSPPTVKLGFVSA